MAGNMVNGGAAGGTKYVKMPIQTVDIKLDEIGYPGWVVTLRTNVRAEIYDMFLSTDEEISWAGFGNAVVDWNFADEEGNPLPFPPKTVAKEGEGPIEGLKVAALPYNVQNFLVRRYVEAINEAAQVPKGPQASLNGTSLTKEDLPVSAEKV